jgi:hypothetical protein
VDLRPAALHGEVRQVLLSVAAPARRGRTAQVKVSAWRRGRKRVFGRESAVELPSHPSLSSRRERKWYYSITRGEVDEAGSDGSSLRYWAKTTIFMSHWSSTLFA